MYNRKTKEKLSPKIKDDFFEKTPIQIEWYLTRKSKSNVYMGLNCCLYFSKHEYFKLNNDGLMIDVTDFNSFPENRDDLERVFLEKGFDVSSIKPQEINPLTLNDGLSEFMSKKQSVKKEKKRGRKGGVENEVSSIENSSEIQQ
jgi:hypothetical protein